MMRFIRLLWVALILTGGSALTLVPAAAVEIGDDAFTYTWSRTDRPVAESEATRTWMWGPAAFTSAMEEWYAEGVGNARVVQYFDKTRMEISTDPTVAPNSIWYVTNGLLAKELVSGEMQSGDNDFEVRGPAAVNVAGDVDDSNGPLYASFTNLLDRPPLSEGALITQRVQRDGSTSDDPDLASQTIATTQLVSETNHTIAEPFWNFMISTGTVYENGEFVDGQLFENPFFATGLPISEPYWADVKVAGVQQLVLIQVFERRVLTFTPGNPTEWQVEAGNVGQHYYRWRYRTEVPGEPPTVDGSGHVSIGPNFLPNWPVELNSQVMVSFGNQAPHELIIQMDGPISRTITLPACDNCPTYDPLAPPTFCRDDIPWQDDLIPAGNYRVRMSWNSASTRPLAGPQTYVPDAGYRTCFFIVDAS